MHRILKSGLILSKANARWVPRLLSVDDCEHNRKTQLVTVVNYPTSLII